MKSLSVFPSLLHLFRLFAQRLWRVKLSEILDVQGNITPSNLHLFKYYKYSSKNSTPQISALLCRSKYIKGFLCTPMKLHDLAFMASIVEIRRLCIK